MATVKKFFPVLYPKSRDLSHKKWFIKYYIKDYEKGILVPRSYKGLINKFNTVAEREAIANQYIAMINNDQELPNHKGVRLVPEEITNKGFASIGVLYHDALKSYGIFLKPKAKSDYKSKVKIFLLFIEQHAPMMTIGRLNQKIIKQYIQFLKEKGNSNITINKSIMVLSALFDEICRNEEHTLANPFKNLKRLPKDGKGFKAYDLEIEEKIQTILPEFDSQLYLASMCIYYCFIRISELRKLQIKHINFTEQIITIPAAIAKTAKPRIVIIPNFLFQLFLEKKMHEYPLDFYVFGKNNYPAPNQIGINSLSVRFDLFRKHAKIDPQFKLYGLKHTGNSKLVRSGVNTHIQQLHNGHSSLEYTQLYNSGITIKDTEILKNGFPEFGKAAENNTSKEFEHLLQKLKEYADKN